MKANGLLLAGAREVDATPWRIFDERALAFLEAVPQALRASPAGRTAEIAAFGFWCRHGHLEALARRHAGGPAVRLGRGLAFHLAPANVPCMYAYSFAVGLLAGNANIVRVSSRVGEAGDALAEVLRGLLAAPEHEAVARRTAFVRYERSQETTAAYLAASDAHLVWGGDDTVKAMAALPAKPGAVRLAFPDRDSLALFSQSYVSALDEEGLALLARRFYNDTYIMDQNGCSCPRLVLWLQDGGEAAVRRRFWEALARVAEREYHFDAFRAARKLEACTLLLMEEALAGRARLARYAGNILQVVSLRELPAVSLPAGYGLFCEAELPSLDGLLPLASAKMQTLVTAGVRRRAVAECLAAGGARGIDRIVPPGQALQFDTVWDGRDLVAALSRQITAEEEEG